MSENAAGDYTRMVEYYDHLMLGGYYDYNAQADSVTPILPPRSHVLEIGIGTGLLAQKLLQRGFLVTGIDITQAMLDKAAALVGQAVPLHQVDLAKEDLPGGPFDAAISNGGVWYGVGSAEALGFCGHIIDDAGVVHSIKTVADALAPGGQLILSIQDYHADKTMDLPDGILYQQTIFEKGNGVFDKEYAFKTEEKILSRMLLPLRYYDKNWFEELLADHGLQHHRFAHDGRYVAFRKGA